MNKQPKSLQLAEWIENDLCGHPLVEAADELRRLHDANINCIDHFNAIKVERDELLAVLKELQESAAYWSEYDVPLGIVDRINAAVAKASA